MSRNRLRRTLSSGLVKFLDKPGRGYWTKNTPACRFCMIPEAFDALYEFARAKELLLTTDIGYRTFLSEYVVPVFGNYMKHTHLTNCLRSHIRPALRREGFIYELEQARREGRAPSVKDIDDFCLGRESGSEFELKMNPVERLRPTVGVKGDMLDDPEGPIDPLSEEEIRLYGLAAIDASIYDEEADPGVTRYRLIYWRDAMDGDKKSYGEQQEDS